MVIYGIVCISYTKSYNKHIIQKDNLWEMRIRMYPYMYRTINYDELSSGLIIELNDIIDLLLRIETVNSNLSENMQISNNPDFINYLNYFNLSIKNLLNSREYLNTLIYTKNYSQQNICYFLRNLIYPALINFIDAFNSLFRFKQTAYATQNYELNDLYGLIFNLNNLFLDIMYNIKYYQSNCINTEYLIEILQNNLELFQ